MIKDKPIVEIQEERRDDELDKLWKDTLKEKEKLLKEIELKKQELINKQKEPKETQS